VAEIVDIEKASDVVNTVSREGGACGNASRSGKTSISRQNSRNGFMQSMHDNRGDSEDVNQSSGQDAEARAYAGCISVLLYCQLCDINLESVGTKQCGQMLESATEAWHAIQQENLQGSCIRFYTEAKTALKLQQARVLLRRGCTTSAKPLLLEAQDCIRVVYGEEHPEHIPVLLLLGECTYHRSCYLASLVYFQQAQSLIDSFFPDGKCQQQNLLSATTVSYYRAVIASALAQQTGTDNDARILMTEAYQLRLRLYESCSTLTADRADVINLHPRVVDCVLGLSIIEYGYGNYLGSLRYARDALDGRLKFFGIGGIHASCIEARCWLGQVLEGCGHHSDAAREYSMVLQHVEEGQDTVEDSSVGYGPLYEYCRIRLGAILCCFLSQFEASRPHIRHAGKALCELVGNEHIWILESLHLLSQIYTAMGKYAHAKKLLSRAMTISARVVGSEDHPFVGQLCISAAANALCTGYYKSAASYLSDGFNLLRKHYLDTNPVLCKARRVQLMLSRDCPKTPLNGLDEVPVEFSSSMDNETLEKAYAALLEEVVRNHVPEAHFTEDSALLVRCRSWEYAIILMDAAEFLRRVGKVVDAVAFLEEAVTILNELFVASHIDALRCRLELALCQLSAQTWDSTMAALTAIEQSILPTLQATVGIDHPLFNYAQGVVGLCKLALHDLNPDEHILHHNDLGVLNSTNLIDDRDKSSLEMQGQTLVNAALDYFDRLDGAPFADSHPWIIQLGGWSNSPRSSLSPRPTSPRTTQSRAQHQHQPQPQQQQRLYQFDNGHMQSSFLSSGISGTASGQSVGSFSAASNQPLPHHTEDSQDKFQ
jgi:tetratricopeptide (TPR) repeat protein